MKNFLTKLSVLVACLSFVLPASAYSMWLAGSAGAMGSDTEAGWSGTSFIEVTSDANGDVYFWANGNFKLSKVTTKPTNWDSFNDDLVQLNSSGNITWKGGDDSNVGAGKKYVKFHMEEGKDSCTIQDTPFTPGGGGNEGGETTDVWTYYSLRGSGDSDYAAGKRVSLSWNSTEKQYEGTLTVDADQWTCKVTIGKSSSNKDDQWFGPSGGKTVSQQTNFGVEKDGGDIVFKKGTYNLYLKTQDGAEGKIPTHLYITGGNGGGGETHNYTYTLKYWTPDTEIAIVPGEAKTISNLAGKGFGIALKENGKEDVWYNFDGSAVKDIEIGEHTYNIRTGGNNFNVPSNVGETTFTLNVDASGKPVSLSVIAEENGGGGETTSGIYIFGDFHAANTGSDYSGNSWSNKTWKKMTLSGDSQTVYEFKFSANQNGKVYFRINDNGKEYGPTNTSTNHTLLTDDSYVDAGENGSSAFEFEAQKGHTYYIKYTTDHHSVAVYDSYVATPTVPTARPTSLYFYSNNFGELGEKVPLMVRSADGKTFTYRFNYTANTPIKFNFREYPADWRGVRVYPAVNATTATLSTNLEAKYDIFNADPKKMWSFTSESGDPVTVTVSFPSVSDAVVTVTQAPAPAGEAEYYIHAGFLNNWDRSQRVKFIQIGDDPKVLKASVRYHEYNPGNKGFKITDDPTADNGKWYSTGSELKNGEEVDLGSEKGNMKLYESALGKAVTYTLTLNDDKKPVSIKAEWVGNDPIVIGNQMPVYPIGVYTNSAFKRYDEWPVFYLKGRVLNDMRVTPEYQLTQVTPTKYELEFTARNSQTNNGDDGQYKDEYYSVIAYFDANSDAVEIGKQSLDLTKIKTYNDREHDGTRYKVVCEKGADGNWSFTLTPVGEVDDIPFISMVGQDWYQRDNYKTPYGNKYTNEDPSNSGTKWGWQEAWIQYDSNGQVLKDRKGNVMYNTMWPPRNPIVFKTEFTVGGQKKNFSLNSKDLTFVKVGTHSGKEWKEHEFFKSYNKESHDKSNPSEHTNALALDENTQYTLYRVANMWINGHVKIWTGWGGVTYKNRNNTKDLANWDFHTNWGHYKKGVLGSTFKIGAGSTVPLTNEYGDMEFEAPTYFKYVDLFIDNSAESNKHGYSVLFTELAKGGAQIAALSGKENRDSANEYEVGNYQPSLNCLEGVKNGIVKNVTINCYSSSTGEMVDHVFDWKWNGQTSTKVPNTNFKSIFDSKPSMVFSNENDENANTGSNSDANGGSSIGKWVKDLNSYVSGDYFYRMLVTLSEDADGLQTHNITVDSNPFTIVKPEAIDIDVYQLVKIRDNVNEDGSVAGGVVKGEYYTYKADPKDVTKSLLPIYKLTIINDDKFDGESYNFEYDDNGNMIGGYIDDSNYEFSARTLTEEEIEKVDFTSSDLQITDKILIVGSRPTVNSVNGYSFSAENVNGSITPPVDPDKEDSETEDTNSGKAIAKNAPEKEGAPTEEYDQSYMRPEQNNRFMHVTNAGTFNQREITVKMEYLVPVVNGDVVEDVPQYTDPAVATYQPIIPEPTLVDTKVEVFYGSNGTESTDDDTDEFEYAGEKFTARFHNLRDYIEIEYPNVSRYMMERMRIRDFFSISMYTVTDGDSDPDNDQEPDVKWPNVFAFGDNPDPVKQSSSIATGEFMLPKDFHQTRKICLEKKDTGLDGEPLVYMPRWGGDKYITPITVTDKAPKGIMCEIVNEYDDDIRESNPAAARFPIIYQDMATKHIMYKFILRLKDDPDYEHTEHVEYPDDPEKNEAALAQAENDDHNYIFHHEKTQFEALHHHSSDDYYYVAIMDNELINPNTVEDDSNAIIYRDSNGVIRPTGSKYHALVKATDILEGDGYEIPFYFDCGDEYQLDEDFTISEEIVKDIVAKHEVKKYSVYVSYLYPFGDKNTNREVEESTENNAPAKGIMREVSDYSTKVLKSQATKFNGMAINNGDVVTGVSNLNSDEFGGVNVGKGFIEVSGNGVQITDASGVVIGLGEGRYDVVPGVYVVRYNGKTTKVVVR